MAFSSIYAAIDTAKALFTLIKGGPPFSTAAQVLLDNDGNPVDLGSIVTAYVPVTTDTITATTTQRNETAYLVPAGTIAAATYVFPSNANSRIGQELWLSSTAIVTALTVTSTGLTLKGTAVTALAVNTPVAWRKVAASTWLRVL